MNPDENRRWSREHPEDAVAAPLAGQRLGVYEVRSLLGSGGMGTVYRARDMKLGRDVALKVLPPAFTADADRRARFGREARALAALNHPNIATLFAFEELAPGPSGDPSPVSALVLELVEGETLAERLARRSPDGRLPLAEAVFIARQIADALEAAHEKGIIHRDLKPANVKITPDGVVKVLDFGLAKLAPASDAPEHQAAAETITSDDTRWGLVVGTAAYMSPEQARGHALDRRTDVWAFGCVLYEMLAGRPAFARATAADTVAAVLERPPDWDAIPQVTPPAVRRLLRRCLEKDPKRRLRDIGDARLDLDDVIAGQPEAAAPPRAFSRGMFAWGLGAALVAVAGVLSWTLLRDRDETASPPVVRTTVLLPTGQELDTSDGAEPLTISPDGARVAYVARADGRTQLFIRALDAYEAAAIEGSEGAKYPFFSPDGQSVAFFADRKLKRLSLRGGSPVTICDAPVVGRGGAWSPEGTIVFDPGDRGLMRVPAAGGRPELLKTRDADIDGSNLSWPQFLPGGNGLLVTVGNPGSVNASLAVLNWQSGEWTALGSGSQSRYMSPGYLVYHAPGVREGELHAARFDPVTLTVGGAAAVLDTVYRAQDGGAAYFAVAQNGTLAFAPGGFERVLVSVDRTGRRTPMLTDRRGFRMPDISPDGRRVAVTIDPRPSQIWVYDLARRAGVPLASTGHSLRPLWLPDSQHVAYTSDGDIFTRAADAGSPAERLVTMDRPQYPTSWSADGRTLVFNHVEPSGGNYDVWTMTIGAEPRPLVSTPASESQAQLSPDGGWLAYQSDESGRMEIYVRPFPDVSAGKWMVSTAGGLAPRWSPDGRTLFYALGSAMMAVSVSRRGQVFEAGAPDVMFTGPFDPIYTSYAVAPDGQHFVMVESDPLAQPTHIHVVLNWVQELARLVAQR